MTKPVLLLAFGLAAASFSACAQEPSDEDYNDIASAIGALTADGSGAETDMLEDVADLASGVASGLTESAGGMWTGTRGGVRFAYAVECRDSEGAVLVRCEGARSASVRSEVEGNVTTARRDGSFRTTRDWDLTGIGTGKVTFNAEGTLSSQAQFMALIRPEMRSWMLEASVEHVDVVWDASVDQIASGTILWEISAERERTTRNRSVETSLRASGELIFLGNRAAQLTLDGTRVYSVDLIGGTVTSDSN
ncbi:MAG: hypothetical protein AAFZ18_14720 [Myxococcota bacterium]